MFYSVNAAVIIHGDADISTFVFERSYSGQVNQLYDLRMSC